MSASSEARRSIARTDERPGLLVIAQRSGDPADLWGALRASIAGADQDPQGEVATSEHAWTARADGPEDLVRVVTTAIDDGAVRVVILPVAALTDATVERSDAETMGRAVDEARGANPTVEIRSFGPWGSEPDAAAHVVDLLRIDQPVDGSVTDAALARVFGDRTDRLGRFLLALRDGLPDDTTIHLRGSAVNGTSYESGQPFDARGPGTSDLDVVVVGAAAGDLWVDEARLLGGVNSLPLCDGEEWVAPALDPARREAQAIVGRPVSIQSMAQWFLDLRAAIQDQAYISLEPPQ